MFARRIGLLASRVSLSASTGYVVRNRLDLHLPSRVCGALQTGPSQQIVRSFSFGNSSSTVITDKAPTYDSASATYLDAPSGFLDTVTPLTETAEALAAGQDPTLASVGLGSWMPPGWIQHLLDYLHGHGLSWCAAIIITTFVVRALTLPLTIIARKRGINFSNHMPTMMRLRQRMMEARFTGNQAEEKRLWNEMVDYQRRNNVKATDNLFPLIQAPIFLTMFYGVRSMADAHLPSMVNGGALWFTNLCEPDPYLLLPILTSATLLTIVETGAEGVSTTSMGNTVRWVMRGIIVISVPFMWHFPSALNLYWFTSNVISLALALALRRPALKQALDIPDILQHDPAVLEELRKGSMLNRMRQSNLDPQQQAQFEQLLRRVSAAQRNENNTRSSQSHIYTDDDTFNKQDSSQYSSKNSASESTRRTGRVVETDPAEFVDESSKRHQDSSTNTRK